MFSKDLLPYVLDVDREDSRNITLTLKTDIGMLSFTSTHAPHSEIPEPQKQKYSATLHNISQK